MTVMTFEEWCAKNKDLVEDVRAYTHPSGVAYGVLADHGIQYASDYIEDTLRVMYMDQLQQDRDKLTAWNKAVSS